MIDWLLITSVVLLLCVITSKVLFRFGVPSLLIFMALGMAFGSEGLGVIQLNDFELTRQIGSIALIFIIFYGGFGTSWKHAKPVAVPSVIMASLGVVVTAGLTGLFCWLVLGFSWLQGLLVGSVVASTDAAAVFSILRSRDLNLKGGLASLLEMESGSNDPAAYMMTLVVISLIMGSGNTNVPLMVIQQVGVGLAVGSGLALLVRMMLRKVTPANDGLYPLLIVGVALMGYSLTEELGGNGYLGVYVAGIILGNSGLPRQKFLFPFSDALSWSMQIILFFTLGLLVTPSRLPEVIIPGLLLFLFMLLIARPVATFAVLRWFKFSFKQQLLVSWVGLRGAASIVFAIYAVTYVSGLEKDLFHLVFMLCLLSIIVQGSLIPQVAKVLNLVEKDESVFTTFTDYEDFPSELVELTVEDCSPIAGMALKDTSFPAGVLVIMIKRQGETIIPNGLTEIQAGDRLVVSAEDREALEKEARKSLMCTL